MNVLTTSKHDASSSSFILGEVTDSTESTSGSYSSELPPPPPVNNPKALQSRRSLLELMQAERKEREVPEEDLPLAKRQKVDKEQEVRWILECFPETEWLTKSV